MKQKFFTVTFFAASLFIISTKTFAQADSGGLDTGGGTGGTVGGTTGGTTPPPTPAPMVYTFKRNNGNGLGVCGGDAQIRVAFSTMPTTVANTPSISQIWYDDGKNGLKQVTSVQLPIYGDITDKTQPYVSYCVTGIMPAPGNSVGNINPAIKLTLCFGPPLAVAPTTGTYNGIDITQ
jgi:hypothetical protein